MWKPIFFLFLILILMACNLIPHLASTRPAANTSVATATWTKIPTATVKITATAAATFTRTPTATRIPTITHTPTQTPNIEETESRATEQMAITRFAALQDQASGVCEKKGLSGAPEWSQDVNQINRAVICSKDSCEAPSDYFNDEDISQWDPKDISQLHLVVCEEWTRTVLQRCTYRQTGGIVPFMVERIQEKVIFTTYAAKTSDMVGKFQLSGGIPEYCPSTMYGLFSTNQIFGKRVDRAAIFQKLNRLFHLPIE